MEKQLKNNAISADITLVDLDLSSTSTQVIIKYRFIITRQTANEYKWFTYLYGY